jgi:hypothetical protein
LVQRVGKHPSSAPSSSGVEVEQFYITNGWDYGDHVEAKSLSGPTQWRGLLTTRTDADNGVVTILEDHTVAVGDSIDVQWVGGIRWEATVSAVDGMAVSFGGAIGGDDLPAINNAVFAVKRLAAGTVHKIAKPWKFRQGPFDGREWEGIRYHYTSPTERLAIIGGGRYGTLTTRTSGVQGIVTLANAPPSELEIEALVGLYWVDIAGVAKRRIQMEVAEIAGNTVRVVYGSGTNLPMVNTAVSVVTVFDEQETQAITPAWATGERILAMRGIRGGTGVPGCEWEEENNDARAWMDTNA